MCWMSGSCSQESPATELLEQAILHRRIRKGSDPAPKGNCLIRLLQGLHQPPQVPVSQRDFSVVIPYEHRIVFSQLSTNDFHYVQQSGKIQGHRLNQVHTQKYT